MSSIVKSILSSTQGLLWNKTRDATAKRLKDGDVTDAQIREIVVREINDIKTTLDGLSHKDLVTSYTFLTEGIEILNDSLDKLNDEQKAVVNEDNNDNDASSSAMLRGGDFLNDALQLSQAMGKSKIVSQQPEIAKKRFEDARKKATEAFCTKALSIQDRIIAAKVRVASEMLECVDSPKNAVTSCLKFLQRLHDLPAVQEIFSVYLGGGVKSKFGKTERGEIIMSIMMINNILYKFVQEFNSKYYSVLAWPIIQLKDGTFNPILGWQNVYMQMSLGDELIEPPNRVKVHGEPLRSAVNSRGEITVGHDDGLRIFSMTGESKLLPALPVLRRQHEESNQMTPHITGVAVDQDNNVYLIVLYKNIEDEILKLDQVVLNVFDEHCNHVKHKGELNFLPKLKNCFVPLAVNKNKDIVMIGNDSVYVCDITGQLKYKFEATCWPSYIGASENNEIIIVSQSSKTVTIYSEEGTLKSIVKQPEGHVVRGVAFHFGISKIIVLTLHCKEDSYYLHCYSKTGEKHTSTFLGKTSYISFPNIRSHPSGPAVVVTQGAIFYL